MIRDLTTNRATLNDTFGRADDNIESIKKRFVTFKTESMPVVDYYLHKGLCTKLDGSTTVADTLGDGHREKVHICLSGYSSRILEMRRVPMPAPVPPPREWVIWKPWRQSQDSDSLRTTSRTESMSSAPSVYWWLVRARGLA